MKKTTRILLISALCIVFAGGAVFAILSGVQPAQTENKEISSSSSAVSSVSLAKASENQTQILLKTDATTVSGSGATVSGNTVTIQQSGTYSISGTLENGQIYVDAGKDSSVILSLNGIDISNQTEAAINIEQAGTTQIFLEEGITNKIQSGTEVALNALDDSADASAVGGAIYARDDLSISGAGTLQVYGYLNNGIQTTNYLTVDSGSLEVVAVNTGLKGKDAVTLSGGTFSITTGGDGIKSDDTTGEGYGIITISAGEFTINSMSDGIQAETALEITGGSFTICSGSGSANASVQTSAAPGRGSNATAWDMDDDGAVSTKGIKSGAELRISGGEFSIDSYDDAIHANGSISISGGSFTIAAGDDGMHADIGLTIENGSIQVTKSYEGLEGNQINITGGDISVVSSDDGINAYGGQSNLGFGGTTTTTTTETPALYISGGTIAINANGDGLDSNGNLIIDGGTIIVDGPSDDGNGAIDSGSENGGTCVINGGTILAVGSSGMAETFGTSSKQYSFRYNLDASVAAGSEIVISDQSGNVLFRHTTAKTITSIVFSCPDLSSGETCQVSVNGQSTKITLSSISTSYGQETRSGQTMQRTPQR